MFHVGQKVVCIRGPMWPLNGSTQPVVGKIYTIRDVGRHVSAEGFFAVLLQEIVNDLHWSGLEYNFLAERFRPVKPTSIAVFEALLKPVPAPRQREDA